MTAPPRLSLNPRHIFYKLLLPASASFNVT